MSGTDEKLTDKELADVLGCESVEEMLEGVAGKRGMLFIQVCAGQWVKYDTPGARWTFNRDAEWDE